MTYTLSRHIQIRTALEKDNIFTLKQADQLASVIDAHLPLQSLSEADVDRVVVRHRDEIIGSLNRSVEQLERQIKGRDMERSYSYQPIYEMLNRTEDTLNRFTFRHNPLIMALGGAAVGVLVGLSIASHDPLQSVPLGNEISGEVSVDPIAGLD